MLDRHSMTAASRIMLPTYAALFLLSGANYLTIDSGVLAASPALAYADHVIDLRGWGLLFIADGLLMVAALIIGQRIWFRYALLLAFLSEVVWSVVFAVAALDNSGVVSRSAWLWPAFAATACVASYRSLTIGETDP